MNGKVTSTLDPKLVRSTVFPPNLIRGGIPVNCCRLSKVLKKNSFCIKDPVQSSMRSGSMERETKD